MFSFFACIVVLTKFHKNNYKLEFLLTESSAFLSKIYFDFYTISSLLEINSVYSSFYDFFKLI